MPNNSDKTYNSDPLLYAQQLRAAKIVGVTPRQIRRVNNGEQSNKVITKVLMTLDKAEKKLDNQLIAKIAKLKAK